jgi:hypothetical protein
MPFVKLPQESDDDKEMREMREMRVGGPGSPIYAIPYEFIGHDSSSLYTNEDPVQYTTNYPDWYKLTPAYDIGFSGWTRKERLISLFDKNSSNNLFRRGSRWLNEDKIVTYCDTKDKIAAVASILLLLMTFIITMYQSYVEAKVVYVSDNSENATQCETLTKWANHWVWTAMKVTFSVIPATIVINNTFKRTTLPKQNTRIDNFSKRIAYPDNNLVSNNKSKQRVTMANIQTRSVPEGSSKPPSNKVTPLNSSFSLEDIE